MVSTALFRAFFTSLGSLAIGIVQMEKKLSVFFELMHFSFLYHSSGIIPPECS